MADRDAIFDFIAADSPRAAAAVDVEIRERVAGLLEFPLLGRLGRVPTTRELVIAGTPYVAIYRVQDQTILILNVVHGAQRWPPVA